VKQNPKAWWKYVCMIEKRREGEEREGVRQKKEIEEGKERERERSNFLNFFSLQITLYYST